MTAVDFLDLPDGRQLNPEVAKTILDLGKQRDALSQRISDLAWAACVQAGIDPDKVQSIQPDGTVELRELAPEAG